MPGRLIAKVYVDKTVYAIDKPYDYLVPPELEGTLQPGCRVLVPFGGGNKKVQGLVWALSEETASRRLKPVLAQLDSAPFVTKEQFHIISYLVRNTFCTGYEAVRAVLPAGSQVDVVEIYSLSGPLEPEEMEAFPPAQKRVLEYLRSPKTARELGAFLNVRQNPARTAAVKPLLEQGILRREDKLKPRVPPKTVRMVQVNPAFDRETERLTPKQKEVLKLLSEVGRAALPELCYLCGVTEAVPRGLIRRKAILPFEQERPALDPEALPPTQKLCEIRLNAGQQAVFEGIKRLMEEGKPNAALLYGVTGSGKTLVYTKLIEQALQKGRTAILLVPEIALTPQTVARFRSLFGSVVAVIHSGLSMAQRLQEDRRIRRGDAKIVIGTRSAIFAPLDRIGLILLDEEGEASYKSDASPRYHARDIAKLRCGWHNATLLLGSATPSVDSYYRAQKGDYHLFSLENRYAGSGLPQVYLVDMREEQERQNLSPLSVVLQEQLAQNLQSGEQSILLINRRGYHTYATCMQCGEVIKCPDCSVAMTYHKANGRLMCHYCGHSEPFTARCPNCGGAYLKLTGAGTQKLEDELGLLFPDARVLRMDTDTTFSRDAYETNFDAFRRGNYDILLGTQMIAKGLDFPNVTLVGVLNADSGLYSADYRSGERIFSLITQVVGRSGRSEKKGRAYIQTFDPDNPVIHFAAAQDYPSFYRDEIVSRQALVYPPFCDMAAIGFSGEREEETLGAARQALLLLREEAMAAEGIAVKVLGVTPASIWKLAGKYRYRILMKCRFNEPLRDLLRRLLHRLGKDRRFSRISVFIDVNGDIG